MSFGTNPISGQTKLLLFRQGGMLHRSMHHPSQELDHRERKSTHPQRRTKETRLSTICMDTRVSRQVIVQKLIIRRKRERSLSVCSLPIHKAFHVEVLEISTRLKRPRSGGA